MTTQIKLPQVDIPENIIHLGMGQPGGDLLPSAKIAQACRDAMQKDEIFYLSYGEDRGNLNFRETLADFLSHRSFHRVNPDNLMITNGNSQALDFICNRFTSPGDTVLVEDPSYFLALKIFADHRLKLVGLPMDDSGVVIENLQKIIDRERPAFVYTIPTHHNPAGISLSENRRKKLVSLCQDNRLMLVADEVYHFLTFDGNPPTPMAAVCNDAPVVSLGSFSKILAPGLRLGWVHAGLNIIEKLEGSGVIISGGGLNPFTSQMVNTFVKSGRLDENINYLNGVYKKRSKSLCRALERRLSTRGSFTEPRGGYFVWLELDDTIDTKALRKTAREYGVDFFAGSLFSSSKKMTNCLRLAYCLYDEVQIEQGVSRLARAVDAYDPPGSGTTN